MFRSLRLVSFLSLAALAAISTACRDSGSGDDTNIDAPMGPDSTQGGLTIQEVHAEAMVPGTPVELKGKVVVAIDNFGARKGNFWVAEEAGGEFSGVLVFGAPVEQVALLAVGDKVDITGAEKSEFALAADTSGRTTTELVPVSGGAMTVTKVGTGTVPAPHGLDAAILTNMDEATRYAEYEKWEGVLTRPMCCPPTSGAAAAVIVSEAFARRHGLRTDVRMAAQALTTDTPSTYETRDMIRLVGFDMSRSAARQAYEEAGIGPEDVDVIELHDCFAQNELLSYEALGLCEEGEGARIVGTGDNSYGGRWVVNPSGGLLSKGHPLGATGLAQCYELTQQLRGAAEARQVQGARVALQHNIGLGGACVVTVYDKEG